MPLDTQQIKFVQDLFGYDTSDENALAKMSGLSVEDLLSSALAGGDFESRFNRITRFRLKWTVPEQAIQLVEQLPVTRGAKDLLAGVDRFSDYLRYLLADKGFKQFVDERAVTDRQLRVMRGRLSRLVRSVNDADNAPLAPKEPSAAAKPAKATNAGKQGTPKAKPQKVLKDIALSALISEDDETVMRDAVSRLMRDDAARETLATFQKIYDGSFQSGDCLQFYMLLNGMRFFLRQNASDTAFKIGQALNERKHLHEAAIDADLVNFGLFWAQSAIRSGRTDEAISILTRLHVDYPAVWDVQYQLGLIYAQTNPKAARMLFDNVRSFPRAAQNALLYISSFFLSQSDPDRSFQILQNVLKLDNASPDCNLALSNIYQQLGEPGMQARFLKKYFDAFGLSSTHLDGLDPGGLFGFTQNQRFLQAETPLVSIVMTAYNAAETVISAAESVLNQTVRNLELLIVNDVSTDDTLLKLKELAARDSRVRIFDNPSNIGTYVSKSQATADAKGEFIAYHDSDDWMHPEHLERHLNGMSEGVAANHSRWVRMDDDRTAIIRRGGPYLHDNPASTFVRKKVIDEIGYFDAVRTGADTEFISRMRLRYGGRSVVRIDEPLAVGLHRAESLTQSGVAAFDEHRFSRVRLDYWESWVWAHFNCRLSGGEIFIPVDAKTSRYDAPESILAHRQAEPAQA